MSISRLMPEIIPRAHKELASKLRDIMSVYEKNADLVSIGAYKAGSNRKLDHALTKMDEINEFLTQDVNEAFTYDQTLKKLAEIMK